MRYKLTISRLRLLLATLLLVTISCKKEAEQVNPDTDTEKGFGVIPTPDSILELIPEVDTAVLFDEDQRIMNWVAPPSFSLDMPPVKSQGGEGSCVAWAVGYAARSFRLHVHSGNSYTNLRGEPDNYAVFSPEFLYNISKSPGDCKAGTRFYRALDEIKSKGVCTWQRMPYSSTNGCTTLPNSTQLAEADFFKIESYYRVSNISDIKRIVYSQNPVIIGVKLDLDFWLRGNFIWNSPRGRFVGNHAIVICGWDDSKNAYKIMNSYGTGWGFGGYGWIEYDYLDNVLLGAPGRYEMYVMKTKATDSRLVDISTNDLTNLTTTSVTSGGTIRAYSGPPINKRGIQRYRLFNFGLGSLIVDPVFIEDASLGLGSYTLTAGGLTPNTNYRVRAFAKTAWGTFYGTPISFTTLQQQSVPVVTTSAVTNVTGTSAVAGGNVTSDGGSPITKRGVFYAYDFTIGNSIVDSTSNGTGTGSFTSNLSNLRPMTTYRVTAYADNSLGRSFGETITFTTSATVPTVTTGSVVNIQATRATVFYSINSNGGQTISNSGVCWSTSPNPTIADNRVSDVGSIGSVVLSPLQPNTTYFARAYATNSAGTGYGNQISFTTTASAVCGTITDIDGNVYQTVTIGTQCWMKENLKTTRYNDGTTIPNVSNATTWSALNSGAYCYYDNNSANNSTYGKLYNGYAVSTGKLCPNGWHIPTESEWTEMVNSWGGFNVTTTPPKLKSITGWPSSDGAVDTSGFSALPGGYRSFDGTSFFNAGFDAHWWTSTDVTSTASVKIGLTSTVFKLQDEKTAGYSCRCVKD